MRTETKFGLLLAVGLFFWLRAELALSLRIDWLPLGKYTGYSMLLLPPLLLFIVIRQKKRIQAGGMAFGQGLMAGVITSAIAAVTLVLLFYLYSHLFQPDWVMPVMDAMASKMQLSGWPDAEIATKQAELQALCSKDKLLEKGLFPMMGYGTGVSFLWSLLLCKPAADKSNR